MEKGYSCSESILYGLREAGAEIPDALIDAVAGLRSGIGGSGCVCGALMGSVLALGYLAGKKEKGRVGSQSAELHNKFKEKFKSTCCRVLTRKFDFNSRERKEFCSGLVEFMAGELAKSL